MKLAWFRSEDHQQGATERDCLTPAPGPAIESAMAPAAADIRSPAGRRNGLLQRAPSGCRRRVGARFGAGGRRLLLGSIVFVGVVSCIDPATSQTMGHTLQAQFVAGGKFPYHINVYFSPLGQYFDYLTGAKGLNGKIGEWSKDEGGLQSRWTLTDTAALHEVRNRRGQIVLATTYTAVGNERCAITQSGAAAQPVSVTTCRLIRGHIQR